jgi:prepilin-type N-terminal cleavage/methylation domain-containing protein
MNRHAQTTRVNREKARRARAGYTLIEVMISIAISAIGISGIVFMQNATVHSNQDAWETQTASLFARTWIERIKRDALLWTAAGMPVVGTMFADRDTALPNSGSYFVPSGATIDVGAWAVPIPIAGSAESAGANYHGVDVGALDRAAPGAPAVVTARDIYYCANTKFITVHTINNQPNAIRATVRVWWMRKSTLNSTDYTVGMPAVRTGGGCEAFMPNSGQLQDPGVGRFRVVYLSTVLRWTDPT